MNRTAELRTKNRNRKKLYIRKYLESHPCAHCGEERPVCLEFHHIEPSIKSFELGFYSSQDFSLSHIDQEIEKCIVLCANCHRVVTAREQQRYNFLNVANPDELYN